MTLRRYLVFCLSLALLGTPLAAKKRKANKRSRPVAHSASRTSTPRPKAASVMLPGAAVKPVMDVSAGSLEHAQALVPFFEQLYRQEQGQSASPVHILHFGDSHTASDDWANSLRVPFQERFGAGGAGYSLAGRPYRYYRRFDVKSNSSNGWYTEGLATRSGDGRNGLGGISVTAHSAGEWVSLSADAQSVEVFYLQQPGGGRLALLEQGEKIAEINTDGAPGPGYFRLTVPAGLHDWTLRTVDAAPVRLFGWVTDKERGVTWETLGINGVQASVIQNWDEEIWPSNVARRNPALVVLAYGTNDASSPDFSPESYRERFARVLQKVRRAAPLASILVIGPPDRLYRVGGRWTEYPRIHLVAQLQREAAFANGCAFWDWQARMGGPGAMPRWVRAGMGHTDYVHLTGAGYRLVGQTLFDELMQQYGTFSSLRRDVAEKENYGPPSQNPRLSDAGFR